MARKVTDEEAAAELLDTPIEVGIWLSRIRHRWYHDLSSGTELDFIFIILLSPVIVWHWLFRRGSNQPEEIGPVFVALTENEIVLFVGSDGIFRRHIKRIYERRDVDDISVTLIDHIRQPCVRFVSCGNLDIKLYYQGPRLKLEEFVSKAT